MRHRDIIMSPIAEKEYYQIEDVIINQYKAPLTAARYMQGLIERIESLRDYADMYAVIPELSVEYGLDVRRINYKQIAIIYTLEEDMVYIQRVMPAGMVIY